MERAFGTLQKRLPPELRLAGIETVEAANRYLRARFVPDHTAPFAVAAAEPGSAFLPYAGRPLEDVLCVQEDRQVDADNCVQCNGRALQILHSATAITMSMPPCACMNIPTAASPSSTARAVWPASTPRKPIMSHKPPNPLGPDACGGVDKLRLPTRPTGQQKQTADI